MSHHILISSLGESPAVVTETIDALERVERIKLDEVVTLGTNEWEVRQGAELLREHIHDYYRGLVCYYHMQIGPSDVADDASNIEYLKLVAETLRIYRKRGDHVYVSLAGGRKTMSALMTIATQIYGATRLCHVIPIDLELEKEGHINRLIRLSPEEQKSVLHPPAESIALVRLPTIGLFTLLPDFLTALGGQDVSQVDQLDKIVRTLLIDSGLLEKHDDRWHPTDTGRQLYDVLSDIEMLPEPSKQAPWEKRVNLQDHHGKVQLSPLAEKLRLFPYAERIDSTDFNSQFDRSRAFSSPQGRLVVEIKKDALDILLITLADSQKGYRLALRTNAKTPAQAERVKRELERFLGR